VGGAKLLAKLSTQRLLQLEIVIYPGYIKPEAEFLNKIPTKVLRVFLLAIHSHIYSLP
jgi:hypothetical protein